MANNPFVASNLLKPVKPIFSGLISPKSSNQSGPTLPSVSSMISPPASPVPAKPVVTPSFNDLSVSATGPDFSKIPSTPTVPVNSNSYTVGAGDTLSGIATKNKMSLSEVLDLNPQFRANPNLIKPGQTINLKNNASPVVPPPAPSAITTPAIPTTTDGQKINIATGGIIGQTPNTTTATNPETPVAPVVPTSPPETPTTPPSNPLLTSAGYEAAMKGYEGTLPLTPEEVTNQENINNLDASIRTGITGEADRPIPLPFITGRQKAIENRGLALEQPLQAKAALLQAKRLATLDASKFKVEQEAGKLSALREVSKPISTTYGGTLSKLNPETGNYETIVNPFGTASGAGGGGEVDVTDVIGQALADGRITSDQVTRYGIPFIASTLEKDPGYNFVTQKASIGADTQSLKTQQLYADSTDRAFKTANANLTQLVQYMKGAGVNSASTIPLINELQSKVKANLVDPGTIAAYQAALAGLRAEYAQVLSRGGEVTEGQRAQAASLIPDNLTPAQLQQVTDRLNIEGTNAVKEAQQKVKDIQERLKSNPGGSGVNNSKSTSPYEF